MNSLTIARSLIEYHQECDKNAVDMTQLRLLKLVYFVYGFFLAETNKSLLGENEKVYAWKYGPVVEKLREKTKDLGKDEITIKNLGVVKDVTLNENEKGIYDDVVKFVYNNFASLPISRLIELVHLRSSPWYKIYYDLDISSSEISDDLTKSYFKKILQNL